MLLEVMSRETSNDHGLMPVSIEELLEDESYQSRFNFISQALACN